MKKILLLILLSLNSFSVDSIWTNLTARGNHVDRYPAIIKELVSQKLYHTSVPYIKEYLVSSSKVDRARFDSLLEEVISHVGDRQFVLLPEEYLERSSSPTLKYLLAKKLLRKRKYDEVLKVLRGAIPGNHPVKPFALQLEAMVFSLKESGQSAINTFDRCISESNSQLSSADTIQKKRQLLINRDTCIIGLARTYYSVKQYDKAELAYLDLDKKSYVWPEILVEEAWNSFYKEDYNRTLGKLVTYNAPVLQYVFNPEIDVLTSMSYLKMCLYSDATKVVEKFYTKYENDTTKLDTLLAKNNKDLKFFFLLINNYIQGRKFSVDLVNELLASTMKDPAFLNLIESYSNGKNELDQIKRVSNRRLSKVLANNLKDSLVLQQRLIGSYVKKNLRISLAQLKKAFMGMSCIKLEILNKRKSLLYSNSELSSVRGDVKYLKRNEKQYFWTFNGEFWADELGDYVFALKSECN